MTSPAICSTPLITVHRHCAIRDLSSIEYELANQAAKSWFESPGFATLYAAATHALIGRSESGQTVIAFYKVVRYLGLFRKVQFVAPVRLPDETIERTMSRNGAQFLSIPLAGRDFLNNQTYGILPQTNWKLVRHAEDIVIQLPATIQEYLSRLGKQTRKHLAYYVRRLEREWGSQLRFVHLTREGIKLEGFQRLVDLNCARMRRKGKRSGWMDDMVANRWRLACRTGLLTGVCRHDQLVAGTICFLHRDEAFLALIAHDPVYDLLNLGSVALYTTIDNLIQAGCSKLHLLWGRGFYKRQFGGEEQDLFEATFFGPGYGRYIWYGVQAAQLSSRTIKRALKPVVKKSRKALVSALQHI